jgi:glycosyltransferase involved in cell wall biosynthesis
MGGAERLVAMLAINIDRKRFEVIPCALRESGPLEEELKTTGIDYRILGIPRRSILTGPLFIADLRRTLAILVRILKELSIDIIHTHLTESTLIGILAARRAGVPRVCTTVHNVVISSERGRLSPRAWLLRAAVNKIFSQADRIVAVSERVAATTRLHTHVARERIITIPNGIEGDRFDFQCDKGMQRRKLGLANDRLIAVTVGRLTQQKGYPYLLSALTSIPPKQRPLTLVVGDGPDRAELESSAIASGLEKDVKFLGLRRDIPELLAAADLFVLPSLWEGLPLVLLEAMAAGLPAVVTAVGGNTEVVEDGISGTLIPPGDAQALTTAVCSLLSDSFKRDRLGRAARQRFETSFSMQRFVEAHERLYEDLFRDNTVNYPRLRCRPQSIQS